MNPRDAPYVRSQAPESLVLILPAVTMTVLFLKLMEKLEKKYLCMCQQTSKQGAFTTVLFKNCS